MYNSLCDVISRLAYTTIREAITLIVFLGFLCGCIDRTISPPVPTVNPIEAMINGIYSNKPTDGGYHLSGLFFLDKTSNLPYCKPEVTAWQSNEIRIYISQVGSLIFESLDKQRNVTNRTEIDKKSYKIIRNIIWIDYCRAITAKICGDYGGDVGEQVPVCNVRLILYLSNRSDLILIPEPIDIDNNLAFSRFTIPSSFGYVSYRKVSSQGEMEGGFQIFQ